MKNDNVTQKCSATRREAIGSLTIGAAALLAETSSSAAGAASLPRSSPEDLGIDPAGILAFVEAANGIHAGGLHSVMVVRHGKVAAEGWWRPYSPRHPHMLYSLSKSFTSTAVGLAISEGLLNVEMPVTSLFPDRLPSKVDQNLAAMKVRHLLTMSTGHEKDATGSTTAAPDGDWVRAFLGLPVPRQPGSLFVYNSAATYMLSAIVQKLTGVTVLDYLTPRLFDPLGFDHPTWAKCPKGVNTGGWGLSVRTEEIARFGQLYLQGGVWNGHRLLPAAWVTEATTSKISNGADPNSDWAQGYCYQFWRCRHGAFRGDGAFGQYCVVMPEQDAVVAITSGLSDMQAALSLVWEHLLPAMQAQGARAFGGDRDLRARLRALSIPEPVGIERPEIAARVSGKVYRFETNSRGLQHLSLSRKGGMIELAIKDRVGDRVIRCGAGKWVQTRTAITDQFMAMDMPMAKAAAAGAWTEPDTFRLKLCFYETPFIQTIVLRFQGDEVAFHVEANVGASPSTPITGRA